MADTLVPHLQPIPDKSPTGAGTFGAEAAPAITDSGAPDDDEHEDEDCGTDQV